MSTTDEPTTVHRKSLVAVVVAGFLVLLGIAATVTACSKAADVASDNLSAAADNFEIQRRIVFINGITDKYLLVVEGRCSLGNFDRPREMSVTCKVGPNTFIKDFVGLSDNVTYVLTQIDPTTVSEYHYRVNFRPESLVPDIRN